MRAGEERVDVEAVRRDDRDRDDEEDDEPRERQAEQPGVVRSGALGGAERAPAGAGVGVRAIGRLSRHRQEAFTSCHAFAYTARRGMSRSRCAFGSVTAFGFVICSAFKRSLEAGRAWRFACP